MRVILMFLILTSASRVEREQSVRATWINWNVGQGAWTTHVTETICRHFDAGGEFYPAQLIKRACLGKMNFIYLTHGDQDHISFTEKIRLNLSKSCLVGTLPIGLSKRKLKALSKLSLCPSSTDAPITFVPIFRSTKKLSTNESSRIFSMNDWLITGDTTASAEKALLARFQKLHAHFLVLAHHGSKTSTSAEFLKAMPELKQAIASARQKKYGHPHSEVANRLKTRGIAMLRTEEWGSLYFEQNVEESHRSRTSN